jgi:origin recognition complex subunit 2
MEEWFQQVSSEECDDMLSLQLDYRFAGDVFTTLWWALFQQLGFKHTGTSYELPSSFPSDAKKEHVVNDIYQLLDTFAIPQLVSSYQNDETPETNISMTPEEAKWWKRIRCELIFGKFHSDIEARTVKRHRRNSKKNNKRNSVRKSKSVSSHYSKKTAFVTDPGAELYIRKTSKRHELTKANSKFHPDQEILFPSIAEYAETAKDYQKDDLETVEQSYVSSFEEWRFLTATNQSLMLYGVGSKQSLLNKFVEVELKPDGDVLVINGYDKDVAIEPILDLIVHKWLNGRVPPMDVHDTHLLQHQGSVLTNGLTYPRHGDPLVVQKAIAIGQALSPLVLKTLRPLYVVIHNIDGVGLRNHTAQEALAALVYHSQTAVSGQNALRLVASVDHVNGPLLLWDSTLYASFQWTWKRVSTYRPYIDEVTESKMPDDHKMKKRKLGEATKNTEQQQQTTKQSTFDVLASFAPRLTQSLHQLVKLQVEKKVEWVEYAALFKRCQLNFTVSSDNQLRVFLGELMDHGIVIADNSNPRRYRVPYGNDGLRQILKFKKSN